MLLHSTPNPLSNSVNLSMVGKHEIGPVRKMFLTWNGRYSVPVFLYLAVQSRTYRLISEMEEQ